MIEVCQNIGYNNIFSMNSFLPWAIEITFHIIKFNSDLNVSGVMLGKKFLSDLQSTRNCAIYVRPDSAAD